MLDSQLGLECLFWAQPLLHWYTVSSIALPFASVNVRPTINWRCHSYKMAVVNNSRHPMFRYVCRRSIETDRGLRRWVTMSNAGWWLCRYSGFRGGWLPRFTGSLILPFGSWRKLPWPFFVRLSALVLQSSTYWFIIMCMPRAFLWVSQLGNWCCFLFLLPWFKFEQ